MSESARNDDPGAARETVSVAIVVPEHGPAGLFGPSCRAAALLAVDEVNSAGGIRGRELRPVFFDGAEPSPALLSSVSAAIAHGAVQGVTGWHISSVRNALLDVVHGRVPYVYPTLWEGGTRLPGLICVGETPDQQIVPALTWLRDEAGVRRWFVAGDDYVWSRRTTRFLERALLGSGVDIVSRRFLRLGGLSDPAVTAVDAELALKELLDAIECSGADGVLMLFLGMDGAKFNRAFAARGLDAGLLRFSPAMDETMLLASGPDATRGLCVASSYFASATSPEAMDFSARYHRLHGVQAPPLNLMAVSTYDGVRLMSRMAGAPGGGFTIRGVERLRADGFEYEGPRGRLDVSGRSVRQTVRLAVADGLDFSVICELTT